MIVQLYVARVEIVFLTGEGMRGRSRSQLYTAPHARGALEAARRYAEKAVRTEGEWSAESESGHSLGSLQVQLARIGPIDDRSIECADHCDEDIAGVTEWVRLDWKRDYPGPLDLYIESAVTKAEERNG